MEPTPFIIGETIELIVDTNRCALPVGVYTTTIADILPAEEATGLPRKAIRLCLTFKESRHQVSIRFTIFHPPVFADGRGAGFLATDTVPCYYMHHQNIELRLKQSVQEVKRAVHTTVGHKGHTK